MAVEIECQFLVDDRWTTGQLRCACYDLSLAQLRNGTALLLPGCSTGWLRSCPVVQRASLTCMLSCCVAGHPHTARLGYGTASSLPGCATGRPRACPVRSLDRTLHAYLLIDVDHCNIHGIQPRKLLIHVLSIA